MSNNIHSDGVKFDAYLVPKRNVIHERSEFNKAEQEHGESIETFVRRLFELAANCGFGDHKREWIRDRFIVGIRDKDLSTEFQLYYQKMPISLSIQQ
jgi:hypothetical protein